MTLAASILLKQVILGTNEAALRRVALGTGLVLAGGIGTETQGTDMASSPDGGGLVQTRLLA